MVDKEAAVRTNGHTEEKSSSKKNVNYFVIIPVSLVALALIAGAIILVFILSSPKPTLEDYSVISTDNSASAKTDIPKLIEEGLTTEEEKVAREMLASAYIVDGEEDKALEQYLLLEQSGVVLTHEDYITMAGIAERQGDNATAVDYYTKALEVLPKDNIEYEYMKEELTGTIESLR